MAEATCSMPGGSNLCLLLLGKTGHGKSASGNSILGAKHFKSSPSPESVTSCSERASGNVDGRQVVVVDTPGLVDTRLDADASEKVAMDAFNSGISFCPDGFHALVLVFTFGVRMTEEEKSAIEKLKDILGKDIIRDYTVLLFTHGDNFDPEEMKMTFNEWIRSEGSHVRDLVLECDNRFVLFNNKAEEMEEQSRQRQDLLKCVDRIQSKGKRYTKVLFNQSKEAWNRLIKQRKDAKVKEEVNAVVADISNDLLAAQQKHSKIENSYLESLRERLLALKLKDQVKNMEGPSKGDAERQIKDMDERILSVKKKQEDDEKKRAEMERLKKEAEELERQRQENERRQAEAKRKAEEEHERQKAELERQRREEEARIHAEAQRRAEDERHRDWMAEIGHQGQVQVNRVVTEFNNIRREAEDKCIIT